MIGNLSPFAFHGEESLNTLKFIERAKKVVIAN
jgi:hypothetical protein